MSQPRSSIRAVSVASRLRETMDELRAHQTRLSSMAAETEAIIADTEFLLAAVLELEAAAGDASNGEERAHLAACGRNGDIVRGVVAAAGVSLRHVLGPGAPPTRKAAKARGEAMSALRSTGLHHAAIATVLRVSEQSVSASLRRLERAKAA